MNMTLKRTSKQLYGIFSELTDDKNIRVAVTLEHAYECAGGWGAKVLNGTYVCKRGMHQLAGKNPFETFEVTGVTGHKGILFHCGNTNNDSEGCILLGSEVGSACILESRVAFDKFMALQEGVDEFTLTVT